MPCRFPGPHPGGKLRGIWPGGSPGPQPRGKLRGIWPEGVSRPTTQGEVEGDLTWRGLQAHTQGAACSGGWGSAPSGGVWRTPLTSTAAGATHPTGMHSSLNLFLIAYLDIQSSNHVFSEYSEFSKILLAIKGQPLI